MKYYAAIISLVCFLSLSSCKENKENKVVNTNQVKQSAEELFTDALKSKEKFFLTFWEHMTQDEYYKVVELLKEEGKLGLNDSFKTVYNAGSCKVVLEPEFENRLLKSLTLEDAVCIYELFQKKYSIEPLQIKVYNDYRYIENNPDYQPVLDYFDGKVTKRLPAAFYDDGQRLVSNRIIKLEVNNDFNNRVLYLAQAPIEVNSENAIIVVDQEVFENKNYTYSLDNSDKMREYRRLNYEGGSLGIFGKEFNSIKSNSVTREVTKSSSYAIRISYYPKSTYVEAKRLNKQRLKSKQRSQEVKIEEEKRRKQNAIDEI
jgi:hypothetical protein